MSGVAGRAVGARPVDEDMPCAKDVLVRAARCGAVYPFFVEPAGPAPRAVPIETVTVASWD